jgi:hypothetical protein
LNFIDEARWVRREENGEGVRSEENGEGVKGVSE